MRAYRPGGARWRAPAQRRRRAPAPPAGRVDNWRMVRAALGHSGVLRDDAGLHGHHDRHLAGIVRKGLILANSIRLAAAGCRDGHGSHLPASGCGLRPGRSALGRRARVERRHRRNFRDDRWLRRRVECRFGRRQRLARRGGNSCGDGGRCYRADFRRDGRGSDGQVGGQGGAPVVGLATLSGSGQDRRLRRRRDRRGTQPMARGADGWAGGCISPASSARNGSSLPESIVSDWAGAGHQCEGGQDLHERRRSATAVPRARNGRFGRERYTVCSRLPGRKGSPANPAGCVLVLGAVSPRGRRARGARAAPAPRC